MTDASLQSLLARHLLEYTVAGASLEEALEAAMENNGDLLDVRWHDESEPQIEYRVRVTVRARPH